MIEVLTGAVTATHGQPLRHSLYAELIHAYFVPLKKYSLETIITLGDTYSSNLSSCKNKAIIMLRSSPLLSSATPTHLLSVHFTGQPRPHSILRPTPGSTEHRHVSRFPKNDLVGDTQSGLKVSEWTPKAEVEAERRPASLKLKAQRLHNGISPRE